MAARRRTPLLLLTGFLGSGKTTLLRNWLGDPAFANTMVIVNEIGEVGVDQQVLAPLAGDPLLIGNGCACCDAGGDLVAALEQLFFDRLHRKIAPFSRVVIETTGLAAPGAVLDLLRASEIARERYETPVVLTTFDAAQGASQWSLHPEVRDQIGAADLVILTRTDLASRSEDEAARALLARERPDLAIFRSGQETLSAQEIAEALDEASARSSTAWATSESPEDRHSEALTTAFAPIPHAIAPGALQAALGALFRDAGTGLLRAKGFVLLQDGGAHLVQAEPRQTRIERSEAAPDRFGLTLIAQGARASDLAASLAARLSIRKLGL